MDHYYKGKNPNCVPKDDYLYLWSDCQTGKGFKLDLDISTCLVKQDDFSITATDPSGAIIENIPNSRIYTAPYMYITLRTWNQINVYFWIGISNTEDTKGTYTIKHTNFEEFDGTEYTATIQVHIIPLCYDDMYGSVVKILETYSS